jgi:putative transposase
MVVMDLFTRRIIGFAVEPADNRRYRCVPDAQSRDCWAAASKIPLLGQLRCSIKVLRAASVPPSVRFTNNDPLFRFHRWRANLRILEIDEIKALPCVPTIRREYLDHVLVWN